MFTDAVALYVSPVVIAEKEINEKEKVLTWDAIYYDNEDEVRKILKKYGFKGGDTHGWQSNERGYIVNLGIGDWRLELSQLMTKEEIEIIKHRAKLRYWEMMKEWGERNNQETALRKLKEGE